MKTLYESILDDEDEVMDQMGDDIVSVQWVKDNYNSYSVGRNGSDKFTIENGILNAPGTGFSVKKSLSELTNGLFKFGEVGEFSCSSCPRLKNLNGGPIKTKANFDAVNCAGLKDLKGAPKYVGAEFNCYDCDELKDLTGCPEHVGTDFNVSNCENLKSLKDLPKYIGGDLICHNTLGAKYDDNIKYIKQCNIRGNIYDEDE